MGLTFGLALAAVIFAALRRRPRRASLTSAERWPAFFAQAQSEETPAKSFDQCRMAATTLLLMKPTGTNAAAAAAGAAAAAMTDAWLRQGRTRTPLSAAILLGAALVYPIAGGMSPDQDVQRREKVSVSGRVAGRRHWRGPSEPPRTVGRSGRLGIACHLRRDTHVSTSSRLPRWYPALCAGYDLAMATALSRE